MGYTYTKRIICYLSEIQISLGVRYLTLLNPATLSLRSAGKERWVSDEEGVLTPNTERPVGPQRRGVGWRIASSLPPHSQAHTGPAFSSSLALACYCPSFVTFPASLWSSESQLWLLIRIPWIALKYIHVEILPPTSEISWWLG